MSKKYHRYSPVNVICPSCGKTIRKTGVGVARCLACGAEIPEDAKVLDATAAPVAGGIAAPGAAAAPGAIAAPREVAAPGISNMPGNQA